MFPKLRCHVFNSEELRRCPFGPAVPDVSKYRTVPSSSGSSFLIGLFGPGSEGTRILRNMANCRSKDAKPHCIGRCLLYGGKGRASVVCVDLRLQIFNEFLRKIISTLSNYRGLVSSNSTLSSNQQVCFWPFFCL